MNVRTSYEADADLLAGYTFYEQQSPGLGGYFWESLQADIDSLCLYAGIHRKICGYHRMFSARFHQAIFYRIVGGEVCIWRVLDCRRDPRWIERQVRMRPRWE